MTEVELAQNIAGSASAAIPSEAAPPSQSASASTAQQIQATGPAAVAVVRSIQAVAVATAAAESHQTSASGRTADHSDGAVAQDVVEEPAAGPGLVYGIYTICASTCLDHERSNAARLHLKL